MINGKYQVRAIFNDEFHPFTEIIGTYSSKIEANNAKEVYENQEIAPNFMGCEIDYIGGSL